ncbi:MAG TPA: acyl-CoA thioester hydrolase/BAAT C-terminal domain-containing protein [Thermoplasmata archaeon]|nr:acyl-CoA thioester hydrolase/BAAT C-terminal domain-containing protein [Thermoplasmata archaeon]
MKVRTLRPPGEPVHGTLFLPTARSGNSAVVVIGGSTGREPTFIAEALAKEGLPALSVAYFGQPGLPPTLEGIPLEYFRRAFQYLGDTAGEPRPRLVALGVSRGSEAALLCGVHFPDEVNGVVASVPGNVVLQAWGGRGPAWLLSGEPLPFTRRYGPEATDPASIIAVERIRGPILLVSAGQDRIWPSVPMARAIAQRLRAHGHDYPDEAVEFPEAGHSLGFLVPNLPVDPGPEFDPLPSRQARAKAWPKVIEFIARVS